MKRLSLVALLLVGLALRASAQTTVPYDDFSFPALDPARWEVILEDGSNPAATSTTGGVLTVTGRSNRTGAASMARIGVKGAVEVTALGWTGTNQILQLYSGTGGFTNFIEFGMERTAADGTPILHVWFPNGQAYEGPSPVPGRVSLTNPTVLRIERDGTGYRFLANGQLVYQGTSGALTDQARVFLYGWSSSVSQWDDVKMSGPDVRIDSPAPNARVRGTVEIEGDTGDAASWKLEVGRGATPSQWTRLGGADGSRTGVLGTFQPAATASGAYTLRLTVTAADGTARSLWRGVNVVPDIYGDNPHPALNGRAFVFPNGTTTVAIGENDAYPWPGLYDLWKNGNRAATDNYVATLRARGINVMRIMLEYAQFEDQLLERPLGTYNQSVVRFWDEFFEICEQRGMTVLLTPWDTFWMSKNWSTNPYNAANGGPCAAPIDFITSPAARTWQKARYKFLIDRWGSSPAILAYDLLNEFDIWWDPATPAQRAAWIDDMAHYVRDYELQKWGKAHMLTTSSAAGSPSGTIAEVVYRHPMFEFANSHQYYPAANDPKDIIAPALEINAGVKYSLSQIRDGRPYTDTESGPINKWQTDQDFDDLYFRAMAWAHLASGGAGSGMRWPYRQPHVLSDGMRMALRAMSFVTRDLDWANFQPENVDSRISTNRSDLVTMGSADDDQALLWVIQDVRQRPAQTVQGAAVTFAGMPKGRYRATFWNPATGARTGSDVVLAADSAPLELALPDFSLDVAVTLRLLPPGDVNADLQVTQADAVHALGFAAGLATPTPEQTTGADVNADGTVDITDAAHLARSGMGG